MTDLVDPGRLSALLDAPISEVLPLPSSAGRERHLLRSASDHELRTERRPPSPLAMPPAAEAQLLRRLADAGVAVPAVAAADDGELITSVVAGHAAGRRLALAWPRTSTTRHDLSAALVDRLAQIHELDPQQLGLPGPEEDGNRLQAERWCQAFRAVSDRPDVLTVVEQRLLAKAPPLSGWSLCHNNFHLDNVVYAVSDPAEAVAVVNWELATADDPLSELGHVLAMWVEEPDEPAALATGISHTCDDGFFSRATVTHEYTMIRRCALANLPWYIAVGEVRLAVLTEIDRVISGQPAPGRLDDDPVLLLLERADCHLD